MITIQEWKAMSGKYKSLWLEENLRPNIREARRKPLHGVGVNDASYCTQVRIDGRYIRCPAYTAWSDMLKRAYSNKLHEEHPSYIGVKVCNGWHSFMEFRRWWLEHHVDGWQLDKDILSGCRMYSPEACLFVPSWLNNFIMDRGADRGEWPIGAHFDKRRGKFMALCSNCEIGCREYLGYFDTPEAAHLAWRTRKLELALELKPKMDEIDIRIYPRVIEIINNAK